VLIRLKNWFGVILSLGVISWSTYSAVRLLNAKLDLREQYYLVAYPITLLYSCFVMITIF
jgi:hypothetical protein